LGIATENFFRKMDMPIGKFRMRQISRTLHRYLEGFRGTELNRASL
jgi:hypothetical protein